MLMDVGHNCTGLGDLGRCSDWRYVRRLLFCWAVFACGPVFVITAVNAVAWNSSNFYCCIDRKLNMRTDQFLLSAAATDSIVFVCEFFFSVAMITHEPLHVAWWNFARTCTSTTSRNLLNFKVIGRRLRSRVFWCSLCAW